MSVENLIAKADELGLDGVCLTEHNKPWNAEEISRLRQETGFPVFRGMEVTTKEGDILVYGLHDEIEGVPTAAELRLIVDDVGGYMIAAHPFRGFLMFGFSELSVTPERAAERPIFQAVHAVEAYNCKVSEQETSITIEVAGMLGLPCIAASDAHALDAVGKYYTEFQTEITTEEELIGELAAGRFDIKAFRP